MAEDQDSEEKRIVGARLRMTREALGYAKRPDFVRAIYPSASRDEVDQIRDRLEAYEGAKALPSSRFIRDLKRWRGITFEWLLDGDMSTLRADVYNAIIAYQRRTA